MDPKSRRQHLHVSVGAASLYGVAIGLWIGLRGGQAGWLESIVFAVFVLFGPGVVASRIDAKYNYTP